MSLWPNEQEEWWKELLTSLTMQSGGGLFLLAYPNDGTRIAILNRLDKDLSSRRWRLRSVRPSSTEHIRGLSRKIRGVVRDSPSIPTLALLLDLSAFDDRDVREQEEVFRSLNIQRESLSALGVPVIFMFSERLYPLFRHRAGDLASWFRPAYHFALPRPGIPRDLPLPPEDIPADVAETVRYYHHLVQEQVANDQLETACDDYLPGLAEAYMEAGMYRPAGEIYRALTEYHRIRVDEKQVNRFEYQHRHAQAWYTLSRMAREVVEITPEETTLLRDLFLRGEFEYEDTGEEVLVTEKDGLSVKFHRRVLVSLGVLTTQRFPSSEFKWLLLEALSLFFDAEGLREIAFRLGIDYDDLRGESKTAKAVSLIEYLVHRERLPELVRVGRELRPDIRWPDVADG